MSKYVFLGINHVNFTSKDTGEVINGFKIWFAEKGLPANSVGYLPFSAWCSYEDFPAVFGKLSDYQGKELHECNIEFGRRNRVEAFTFPAEK